jgi:hypothetical protein
VGARAYCIACFVFDVAECATPRDSDELSSEWVPWDEAIAMPNVTSGTRRVARAVRGG